MRARARHVPRRWDLDPDLVARPASAVPGPAGSVTELCELAELAAQAGLRRIAVLSWRDLDDAEAGGSELHAHEVASRWAAAGLEVVARTSSVAGRAVLAERGGYKAVRRSGRYGVFATGPSDIAKGRLGPLDGLVEIWNGMPFFSPVWSRLSKVVFLHHVHGEMWPMTLPSPLAEAGRYLEARLAPPLYRSTPVVTLSESSRREIVALPGMRASRVSVVPPGIDPRFSPGGHRCEHPLVVAVGRLVPVKNFSRLIAILARVHEAVPGLETIIVGEGRERSNLEASIPRTRPKVMWHCPGGSAPASSSSFTDKPGCSSPPRSKRAGA